ncbi:purine-binding protein [Clostridiales bacterium]|nr:BMP family ABC transporter substrate-binding protein [Clostridiales bacterium]GFI55786.1 purine-binding protein [Clostridiales bacterium]
MSRKLLSVLLALSMVFCMIALSACSEKKEEGGDKDKANEDIKIGAILLGDENEGYTFAHIDGIQKAAKALNLKEDQIVWRYSVPENESCYDAAMELVDAGCDVIFSNSFGHQTFMQQAATEVPDVTFVAMTGDTATSSGLDNLCNAFTKVYESRYVSGVVAGMKLAELVKEDKLTDKNYDADGNILIGYVGAYPYAEVVSGYTAFFLGIQSVVKNVSMQVQFTNEWFNITKESEAANMLMASGCVIIGQHADSTGAPSAVQAAHEKGTVAYSVGYNIDMQSVAPDVALTSATNNWAVYYEYAISTLQKGEKLPQNWAEGYEKDAVKITDLGSVCAEGTAEKVEEVVAAIKAGELHVFDTEKFTVKGEKVDSCVIDLNNNFETTDPEDKEAIWDGYFHESELRSAPSFALDIDGITKLNAD